MKSPNIVLRVAAVLLVLGGVIVIWNLRLKREIARRRLTEDALPGRRKSARILSCWLMPYPITAVPVAPVFCCAT